MNHHVQSSALLFTVTVVALLVTLTTLQAKCLAGVDAGAPVEGIGEAFQLPFLVGADLLAVSWYLDVAWE